MTALIEEARGDAFSSLQKICALICYVRIAMASGTRRSRSSSTKRTVHKNKLEWICSIIVYSCAVTPGAAARPQRSGNSGERYRFDMKSTYCEKGNICGIVW